MPRVERSATIAVGPETAFDFVADPRNALRWMHGFTRFDPEDPGNMGVGARVKAGGTVMGVPITTTLEIVELDRPRRLVSRTTGRLKSVSTWQFAPEGAGTRVSFVGEYDVPSGLIRFIGGSLVQRELENNAEMSLANLKRTLESVTP
jgi:carbon monoxide dehydrogenase subunit G